MPLRLVGELSITRVRQPRVHLARDPPLTNTHRSRRLSAASMSLLVLIPLGTVAAPALVSAQASPSTTAATAAETSDVTATDFGYSMYPAAKVNVGACLGPATNVTPAPFYSNIDCGFSSFTLSGAATTVRAQFFHGEAAEPFAAVAAAPDSSGANTYQARIEPPPSWPRGEIRMRVLADGAPAGESTFGHNQLGVTFDVPAQTFKAGQDIAVTGTAVELDNDSVTGPTDKGVPAQFTLDLGLPDGTSLSSQSVTAADDGTFAATLPGTVTSGIAAGEESDYRTALSLSALNATYDDPDTDNWSASEAGTGAVTVVSAPTTLQLENSFVSSVGWVKPGDSYPSRIFVKNPTDQAFTNVSVSIPSPVGCLLYTSPSPRDGL